MRRMFPVVVLSLSVVVVGCKAKEALDKVAVARDLEKRGTVDVLKEASKDQYDAPKDGKLTDAQVQMYLKVRDHERVIAQAAKEKLKEHDAAAKNAGDKSLAGMMEGLKSINTVGEFLTADIRAAKDLGFNTAEYTWVKGQILAASTQAMGDKMADAMNASMEASYQQMKKARDEARDDATKKIYQQSIDEFDKQRAEAAAQKKDEDPAVAYNKQLLSKYENTLNAYANELAKYEDKPGDVQKSVDQWQKDLDKAKADAANKQ
jgi:chromosome segregation ATPase